MSTDSMHKVVRLDEKELQQLTREVKETLAENNQPKKKSNPTFTAAEMWRHHSRVRSASSLIRRWNKY